MGIAVKFVMLATLRESKTSDIVGCRMYDIVGKKIVNVRYADIVKYIADKKGSIYNVNIKGGKLVGINGSLDRYTVIDMKGNVISENTPVVIIGKFSSGIAYGVVNIYGNVRVFGSGYAVAVCEKYGVANGKIVHKGNQTYISAIDGEYNVYNTAGVDKSSCIEQGKEDVAVEQNDSSESTKGCNTSNLGEADSNDTSKENSTRSIPHREFIREIPEKTNLEELVNPEGYSVEQLRSAAILKIKQLSSMCYATLRTIKTRSTLEIATAGVSVDTLYYNPKFLSQLTLGQTVFVYMHEMYHLVMKHRARMGLRNPDMWNVACDLFINGTLQREYKLVSGKEVSVAGRTSVVPMELLDGALYDKSIDLDKESAESIYELLEKGSQSQLDNSQQQQRNQKQQGQQGQQGQGQQGQGQGQGQQGQGQGQQGQQGQGQQVGSAADLNKDENSNISNKNDTTYTYKDSAGNVRTVTMSDNNRDIHDDEKSRGMGENDMENASNNVLQKANTVRKEIESHMDKNAGNDAGSHDALLVEYVNKELAPQVHWRTLVQNYLRSIRSDDKSISTPDKRFISDNIYLEGDRIENELLGDVKICIDTSGSMGPKDLGVVLAQLEPLTKMYKMDAEIVLWDTYIEGTSKIEKKKDFTKLFKNAQESGFSGGGGTSPACLFDEYSKKEYKLHKKNPPELLIIFTDGYLYDIDGLSKYKRAFKDKTIWVLSGERPIPREDFKEPFGKVAKMKHNR